MFYRLVQKANPLDQEHKQRYATSVNAGKIDTRMIAKTLSQKSSLTTGDVMNVLENLLEEIPRRLSQGYSVRTFRLSLSSQGVKEQKEFNTRTIKKKVVFLPSKSFKSELKTIPFEHKK